VPRHVQEHRCKEEHRSVEIEDRRHERDEEERGREQEVRAERQPRQPRARRGEEPVTLGDQPDEQQAADEDERGPGLSGG
jgi:hypothetical protein